MKGVEYRLENTVQNQQNQMLVLKLKINKSE